jgi:ATP-binding cassette subfamily B protein
VAFNALVVQLSWPTIALGWIISLWQRGVAGGVRVRELLVTEPAINDPAVSTADGAGAEPLAPSLEVRGLTVALDDRRLLDDVSFSVPAGTTLAIVGPTGAGKTTLVDALARLQDVAPGAVAVGGRDVTTLPLARLRGLFGYAPQDAFLFSATVAENIAFGVREPLDEATLRARVVRAGEAAGLAPDVMVLPDGWDTLVGERGITLSGGQRQRVALARALASEPRILMLDDTLSSVDAQTEREILTRLRPILRERTSIVVSHRVAAVKEADQILVLDRGRVAELGTHGELLATGGLYASLYREQLAAEALAEDAA